MKRYIVFFAVALTLLSACQEKTLLRPYGENDGIAPGTVSNVSVRNFSGGATLKYTLPMDGDLAYIKARYTDSNGIKREAVASAYVDSLVIRGLGEACDYEVSIVSCDKHENESEAVKTVITPTTPPIDLVFNSLKYTIDFGGFLVEFENPEKADVGIYITQLSKLSNEQEYYDSYFTKKVSGSYAVRGLPAEENEFGVYVQDKWNNRSEMMTFVGTPLYEEEFDKKTFSWVDPKLVPGDFTRDQLYEGWCTPEKLWDGEISNWNYCNTILDMPFPHTFTMDLGQLAKLSRLRIWQRDGLEVVWQHAMWKRFNVWGCTELPDWQAQTPEDRMKGWTKLGEFTSVKPSGSPSGVVTDEDLQLVKEGEEFGFLATTPFVRYVRFEILEVHSLMKSSGMSEIALWGQYEKGETEEE